MLLEILYTDYTLEIHRTALLRAIREAAAAAGSDPKHHSVSLLAVSKGVSASAIMQAAAAGQRLFGESRVQEAYKKFSAPPLAAMRGEMELHFIGRLQRNKAAKALELFDVIQSVDSLALIEQLAVCAARAGEAGVQTAVQTRGIFLQANPSADRKKTGFTDYETLLQAARLCARHEQSTPALRVLGLMTIAPQYAPEDSRAEEKTRQVFEAAARWKNSLQAELGREVELSMGMSGDYVQAIRAGSTMVRIGRAFFGLDLDVKKADDEK